MITFFAPDGFAAESSLTLGEEAAQHARVVRVAPGANVALRDGGGRAARGTLSRIAKRYVTVDVAEVWDIPPAVPVHMLVPVADRDRMLLLAEKCTELGATSWRPVIWRRSRSVGPKGEGPTFQARVRARMVAALTQSGGGWLPDIHPSAPPERAVAASPGGTRLLAEPNADQTLLDVPIEGAVIIAVGPEGGIDERERDEMLEGGFVPVSLPGGVLRFETAGIAALAIVRARLASRRVNAMNDGTYERD